MKNPAHPGEIIGQDVVAGLGLSVTEVARRLGVSRAHLSRVIAGKSRVNANLAYRLELGGVATATFWLNVQTAFDLANLTVDHGSVRPLNPPDSPKSAAKERREPR